MVFLQKGRLPQLLAAALLALTVALAILLRQNIGRVEAAYDLNACLDDPYCYYYAGTSGPVPTGIPIPPDNCIDSESGLPCISVGGGCKSSTSCNHTGSGSCIDGKCNVTATNDQVIQAGGAVSGFSNWYTTADGAWEVRYYRSESCTEGYDINTRCYTYQIRAAAATPTSAPGGGGGGGSWCGNGSCNPGETCATCPADCGVCATCGIGLCGEGQTCQTCPVGCGLCTGDVTARAVYLDDPAPTCDEVRAASSTRSPVIEWLS